MKQMNVVLIGGGTGLSVLARGLREFPQTLLPLLL